MICLALRLLLAEIIFQKLQLSVSSTGQDDSVSIDQRVVAASLRFSLNCEDIAYSSVLPIKLAATQSKQTIDHWVGQLTENRYPPLEILNTDFNVQDLNVLVWLGTSVTEISSGRLLFCVQPVGLAAWLKAWLIQSDNLLRSTIARMDSSFPPELASCPFAERLRVHPLVLVQCLYARCYDLGQAAVEHPENGLSQRQQKMSRVENALLLWGHERPIGQEERTVLSSLIALIDQVAEPCSPSKRIWELALNLTTVTYTWLDRCESSDHLTPGQRILLRAVEKALCSLLRCKFDYPLPKSL